MFDNDTELTPAERAAFDSLPRERAPSDLLEERVVTELRRRGMLGSRRRPLGAAWRIAAAIALFAGGVATGRFILAPANSNVRTPASVPVAETGTERSVDRTVNTVGNPNPSVAHKEMWL